MQLSGYSKTQGGASNDILSKCLNLDSTLNRPSSFNSVSWYKKYKIKSLTLQVSIRNNLTKRLAVICAYRIRSFGKALVKPIMVSVSS